jgi:hypothetical protein
MNSAPANYSPGVLLLGLLLVPVFAFFNPWLTLRLWPLFYTSFPDLWNYLLAVHLLGMFLALRCIVAWRHLGATRLAQFLFERHGWLGGILLTFAAVLATFAIAEPLVWLATAPSRNAPKWGIEETHTVDFEDDDPYLAIRSIPGARSVHRCIKVPSRDLIFSKTCTIGRDGLRITPQPDVHKSFHLAMFGCSFMYGAGANDEETFPSQIAQHVPEAHVYNFAFYAYGPGQTYLQLVDNRTNLLQEEQGAAFFLLMKDHVNRILPRIQHAVTWTRKFPAFTLDGAGRARYAGQMDTAYPWRLLFLDIASQEHLMKWSRADFPPWVPEEGYTLCAAILAAAREEYRKRFPNNEFYVIIDPTCRENFRPDLVIAELGKRGVPVLDALNAFPESADHLYHPRDRHPKPEGHALLAKWFVEQFPDGLLAPPRRPASTP